MNNRSNKKTEREILIIIFGVLALVLLVFWTAYFNEHNIEVIGGYKRFTEVEQERNFRSFPSMTVALPGETVPLQEGHWQGMEVVPLSREIKIKFKIPKDVSGVLVDEVTLMSAKSGVKAGDVIQRVDRIRISSLESFQDATRAVRNQKKTRIKFWRNGDRKIAWMRNNQELGMAQMETAPAIPAGSISPHPYRGPCTRCHIIGTRLHLNPGPGDIAISPPPIPVGSKQPHRDRGVCTECHELIK